MRYLLPLYALLLPWGAATAQTPRAPLAPAGTVALPASAPGLGASRPGPVPGAPSTPLAQAPAASVGLLSRVALGLDPATCFDGAGRFGAMVDPHAVRAAALAGARAPAEGFELAPPAGRPSPPPAGDVPGRTPLEKHAAFFDRDGDGVITVSETAASLRELGLGRARALFSATAIHLGLSASTRSSWWDAARLVIRIENIHKGMHPSDTGVYDAQGRFVQAEFDRIFDRFSKSRPGRLNRPELLAMIEANSKRKPGAVGKAASEAEFGLLLELAADGSDIVDGKRVPSISRERLSQLYDGTLFYRLARRGR
ncbi:MAG: hypothetical protein HY553_20525 [Elusimicrobia bacterium]|nr:hypothetical protein [Elusimicrobiota bacterium]